MLDERCPDCAVYSEEKLKISSSNCLQIRTFLPLSFSISRMPKDERSSDFVTFLLKNRNHSLISLLHSSHFAAEFSIIPGCKVAKKMLCKAAPW